MPGRHTIALAGLIAAAAATAALACAPLASAAGSGMLVTFAARVCPTYTDVSANRARNDIQESLRDLGADTTYRAGEAIDPAVEAAAQPNCRPLANWQFTLGTGYKTRAVSGSWGSLSIVTGAFTTPISTAPSVPLLGIDGRPTGSTIAGATTVELTSQQASLAGRPNSLWVQGGTPSDPILNVPYPGQYGFAALRCAIDNLNGDNVEWIGFPSGTRHVLCFAYYVQPPPTSGTIIVRKQVSAPAGMGETFPFEGNISFNENGRFAVAAQTGRPGELAFIRAETRPGEAPWDVRELVPPNWRLTGLGCSSSLGTSGHTADLAGARATVTLAAGDTVTCTYTDTFVPPNGGLQIRKLTRGGTGTFGFTVKPKAGGAAEHASATTSAEGEAVDAAPGPLSLAPGDYLLEESLPAPGPDGRWSEEGVQCDGARGAGATTVTIPSGAGVACTFTNLFTPSGSIALRKRTLGGLATAGFVISPESGTPFDLHQTATTTAERVPAAAHGDASTGLHLGGYVVQETMPPPSGGHHWELVSVECGGVLLPFDQGGAHVRLSTSDPHRTCTFTNERLAGPLPPVPPPPPSGADDAALKLTKRPLAASYAPGEPVTFEISVVNHGPAGAGGVVVDDRPAAGATVLAARATQGSCRVGATVRCRLGSLAAGAHANAFVTVRGAGAAVHNCAVAGSATYNPAPAGAGACATARRSQPRPPSFTG